ncbi:MAG: hypothetical protein DYG88_02510 [Chloroflexi bacterium CFX4]|nr:hypothetical protein [Chloroflexi bacterium CFX4]MDL1922526.1 hypothetical protein [Chloroflexi bacterium CFX3]
MSKRAQNERKFPNWVSLPEGGRRYWYDSLGEDFGYARYVKIVDQDEDTVAFYQEIYDNDGVLIEIHHKYPIDSGHQRVGGDQE